MSGMHRERKLAIAAAILFAACSDGRPAETADDAADPADYEVWVIDQSDSPDAEHGGMLYVFDAADLSGLDPSAATAYDRVDLAGATSTLCLESTGAAPVRPHMLLFDSGYTHAVISFVASGHVVVMDASTREPLACVRTSASPTGQQAHAAFPSPDGAYILVANQSGKRLERIRSDFEGGEFTLDEAATLDLASCTTPSGASCEAPETRPLNWPICPILDPSGDLAFVTLRGGGLLAVDPRATPMRVVAEYDSATVRGNGCGGIEVGGRMFISSGGSPVNVSRSDPDDPSLYGFEVYAFRLDAFGDSNAPNRPAPEVVLSRDGPADAHGMAHAGEGEYLWVFDRYGGTVEVIEVASGDHVGTIPLVGPLTADPAPDLAEGSPDGRFVFVALRGPTPLSGDPHNAAGSDPGLGVIRVDDGGRSGELVGVIPITNPGPDGAESADVHAVRVRRR